MVAPTTLLPPRPRRRTRANGVDGLAMLQGRVPVEIHQMAAAQAAAAGISMSVYLEQIVRRTETDERGRPLWLADFLIENFGTEYAQEVLDLPAETGSDAAPEAALTGPQSESDEEAPVTDG